MKPCTCGHPKNRHLGWGNKKSGKCLVSGCDCTTYVERE